MNHKMKTMKDMLTEILRKLDAQKAYQVQTAYKDVNREFDFMMNTLLPQSHGELVPVNPNQMEDGLLCNPALFYILDEIDSTLDVNCTSNIGYLIRTKCPQVQFICVSLKDGMYNNANAIFRTYFEDGTSKAKATVKKVKQYSSQNKTNPK